MSEGQAKKSRLSLALAWSRPNKHYLVAATILAVTAAGWSGAMAVLKWAVYKEPVPWPEGVMVHPEDFRLLSLAKVLTDAQGKPRFLRVEEDHNDDGVPDGEIIFEEDETDTLGIGTKTDRDRLPRRCSNWYVARIYRDNETGRLWRLEAYYYTGILDTVPHVPERCLTAGGKTLLDPSDVTFSVKEGPWKGEVPFRRANFVGINPKTGLLERGVEYYTFSLNGRPETSRNLVRLGLTYPWVRYCYFAKIQFAPMAHVEDLDRMNRAAEEFAGFFLPKILEALPMPEDIERLRAMEENKR
ncbi:MAG: hypothetical protein ACYTF6_04850 [Planctomycetota bacterium]|jgi:hypothetical protein